MQPSGSREEAPFLEPEEGQQQPQVALGFETLDDRPVDTPGHSHRQNNGVFLKTSPVSSLLRAGSSNFLSLTWDLLSLLCQQLSPPPARRTAPSKASQAAKAVFHTRLSEACPKLSQGCQQPSWSAASCLPAGDTGQHGGSRPQCKAPTAAVLAGAPEEAAGLQSGDSGAQGCVRMNLEDKPGEAPEDGLPTGATATFPPKPPSRLLEHSECRDGRQHGGLGGPGRGWGFACC